MLGYTKILLNLIKYGLIFFFLQTSDLAQPSSQGWKVLRMVEQEI